MGQSSDTETDQHGAVKVDHHPEGFGESSVLALVARVIIYLIMKFWAMCTSLLLILLLTYWFYGGLLSFVFLLFAVIGFLYNVQDMLLYYPDQPTGARLYVDMPSTFGLPYESFYIKSSDGVKLHAILIKQPAEKFSSAPTVLFFHGNAGNIGHRLMNAYALYNYSGVNVLLLEYRGYGRSHGKPSENGFYLDAQAGMNYLQQRPDINHNRLIVLGRSLGGAVATHLASLPQYANRISCLILENTFTSLPDIGRHLFHLKVIKYLPEWCHKNKYPSRVRLKRVKVPTLFISGLVDDLVPPKMMQEMFDASGSMLKRLARFPDGSHNETWQSAGYYETVNRFLQEVEDMKTSDTTPNSAASYTVEIPFDDMGQSGVFSL